VAAVVLWAPLVPCTTSMLEPGYTSSFAAATLVLGHEFAQDGSLIAGVTNCDIPGCWPLKGRL